MLGTEWGHEEGWQGGGDGSQRRRPLPHLFSEDQAATRRVSPRSISLSHRFLEASREDQNPGPREEPEERGDKRQSCPDLGVIGGWGGERVSWKSDFFVGLFVFILYHCV